MAEVITMNKPLAVNPLKASQPIGASLAVLGLAKAMPLEHGARGCTSFNKLYFMRHYNEPIALQTTAMDQTTTVIGADDNVIEALATVCRRSGPEVIGLITTGLSEMQGADIVRTVKMFRSRYPEHAGVAVVPVSATDTLGCLESGFAAAVEAIVGELVPEKPLRQRRPGQINLLAPAMLTPGDVEEIQALVEAFGFAPVIVPNVGASLDGHMIERGFSTLTYGGTERDAIADMGASIATLVIGRSLDKAADLLKARTGVPDRRFPSLSGLDACDAFVETLIELSGRPAPERVLRQRAQLEDAMVDCQFQLGGARIGIAGDADQLAAISGLMASMGAEVVAAVASNRAPHLAELPAETVVIGDLEDFEWLVSERGAELIVTNSHGAEIARRGRVPLMRAGFPIYDSFAANAQTWVGYRGSRAAIFRAADLLADHYQEIRPYRSTLRQGVPAGAASPETSPC